MVAFHLHCVGLCVWLVSHSWLDLVPGYISIYSELTMKVEVVQRSVLIEKGRMPP